MQAKDSGTDFGQEVGQAYGNEPETPSEGTTGAVASPLMTTAEAAQYMRKSTSWLLHQRDIPYLPGKPNLYNSADLDTWVERHKVRPRLRMG